MKAIENGHVGSLGGMQRVISVAGGVGMLFWAIAWPGGRRAARLAGGVYLLARGVSGRDPLLALLGRGRRPRGPIEIEQVITIEKPREEIYAFWRDFANLPRVMSHLDEVRVLDADRSHWKARTLANLPLEWDSELTVDRPNERLSWRSLPGSQVGTEGTVRFAEAPAGFGTELRVRLSYQPPLGRLGTALAKLFGADPDLQIREDLRHFKQALETGQVPSVRGQSSARLGEVQREREEGEGAQAVRARRGGGSRRSPAGGGKAEPEGRG